MMGFEIFYGSEVVIRLIFPYIFIYGLMITFGDALRISIRRAILITLIFLSIYMIVSDPILFEMPLIILYLLMFGLLLLFVYFIQKRSGQPIIRHILWMLTFSNVLLLLYPVLESGVFLIIYFSMYGLLLIVVNWFQTYSGNFPARVEIGIFAFSNTLLLIERGREDGFLLFFVVLTLLLLMYIFRRWRDNQITFTPHELNTMVLSNLVLVIITLVGSGIFFMAMLFHASQFSEPYGPFPISPPSPGELMSEFNVTRVMPAIFLWLVPLGFTSKVIKSRSNISFWLTFLVTSVCHTIILVAIYTIGFLQGVENSAPFGLPWITVFFLSVGFFPYHAFTAAFSTLLAAGGSLRMKGSKVAP